MARELTDGLHWLHECHDIGGRHEHVAVYCLTGEETVVVDTGSFHDREAITGAITRLTDGAGPDAIVLSHTDYPHAANVDPIRERWGDVDVVASCGAPTIQGLPADARTCDVGETVTVGSRELTLIDPPLADRSHTMWVLDEATGTLFTADGFGARHAPGACDRTAAELGGLSLERVREYHASALSWLPYADAEVLWAALEAVFGTHEIERIAPVHGPPIEDVSGYLAVWREGLAEIVRDEPLPGDP